MVGSTDSYEITTVISNHNKPLPRRTQNSKLFSVSANLLVTGNLKISLSLSFQHCFHFQSNNVFPFSESTGPVPKRTRTTATWRASPTLSARTTSGCSQWSVRNQPQNHDGWDSQRFRPKNPHGFPFFSSSPTLHREESGWKFGRKFWVLAPRSLLPILAPGKVRGLKFVPLPTMPFWWPHWSLWHSWLKGSSEIS